MPAARGITPLPARESGKGPGAAARLPWGAGCPRGWRRPLRPRGRRRLAAGGPSAPRPAKQKAEAGGKASGLSFSGRFAPRRRPPLGNRDAIPLAPETWRMRQEKGGRPLRRPPVMAVSPIYPPLGMLPMACRYASTSSRKPSMPSRSETRSSPRPMCFIR